MTDREWKSLFDLISKAVHVPGKTADEKAQDIAAAAGEYGNEAELEEFVVSLQEWANN